ncbi:hypothetical protein CJD36_020685 [Flavipsychrobacter stenotrophus]|uniref:RDD domain-containing protein n=1 Tax=Flavipsychrobacter stenotrophus TaxID=2077091 RepID=A0A2S7SRG4_9BACT|nr:RDD family protein [Flavipsychrobacter stenotrophus]PQJ09205.1 hypothetical protein CJD36_020685 [Flavipsychrobacter stenotrophus]
MEIIEESIFPEYEVVYAGFWRRFGGAFIDGLVLIIPNMVISFSIGAITTGWMAKILALIVQCIVGWLYSAYMESGQNQATIGKQAVGLIVTDLRGDRLTFSAASIRYWAKLISGLIIFIGYFMMLWDDKKQTFHDKMADALVVKK